MTFRSRLIRWLGGVSGEGMVTQEVLQNTVDHYHREWRREMDRLQLKLQRADRDRHNANMAAREFQMRMEAMAHECHQLRNMLAQQQFWGRAAGPPPQSPPPKPQFTQEEIASMIRLCHPDKHGNSEAANRVTKVLLAARK